ncbi:MAG: hypothetical protein A2X49_00335 [Lentisphaerae bacterium GWF2_52_8]|nr:MAG: hypothetical protein A2X49_00335 [Lentisphaerae bacterium GWF2_52_8]
MPYLQYKHNGIKKHYEIPPGRLIIFGREEHVDFQLGLDPKISREHFAIQLELDGKLLLIDLGAMNGTFLNGKKIENDAVELHEGDVIRAGTHSFIYFKHIPQEPVYRPDPVIPPSSDTLPPDADFASKMRAIVGGRKK